MKIMLHTENIEVSGKIIKNVFTIIFLSGLLVSGYKGFAQASLNYATSIDITTASFSGTAFSVAVQETFPGGVTFNNDGTKMYVVGANGNAVFEYVLSTPFDVNSAGFTTSFFVFGQKTALAFNNDGTKLYILGAVGRDVDEYALSTAFDVSSAGFTSSFSVAVQETSPTGLAFNNDGTKMYVVGRAENNVNEYALGMAFDVSTTSFTTSFSVAAQETSPEGLVFNNNGTKMYVVGRAENNVFEYVLSTPFDVSSASFTTSFSVAAQESLPLGLAFNNDGTKMYVVGSGSGDDVDEYNLSNNAFAETLTNNGSVNGSLIVSISNDTFTNAGALLTSPTHFSINNLPSGLTPSMSVSSNGLTATLTFSGNAASNEDTDDITDILFTFNNAAFSSGNATVVINAINASSNLGIDFEPGSTIPALTYATSIDITTASFSGTTFTPVEDNNPKDLAFNNDGTKMYVVGNTVDGVLEYTLNTVFG